MDNYKKKNNPASENVPLDRVVVDPRAGGGLGRTVRIRWSGSRGFGDTRQQLVTFFSNRLASDQGMHLPCSLPRGVSQSFRSSG